MSDFTPGPWEIKHGFNVFGYRQDGKILSVVASTGGYQSNTYEANTENAANARLIAAAPDLLEALREFIQLVQSEAWTDVEIPMIAALPFITASLNAEKAIAKARGES